MFFISWQLKQDTDLSLPQSQLRMGGKNNGQKQSSKEFIW